VRRHCSSKKKLLPVCLKVTNLKEQYCYLQHFKLCTKTTEKIWLNKFTTFLLVTFSKLCFKGNDKLNFVQNIHFKNSQRNAKNYVQVSLLEKALKIN
jgi:hypothetical protein